MAGTGISMKTSSISALRKDCLESAWLHPLTIHKKTKKIGSETCLLSIYSCSAVPGGFVLLLRKLLKRGERQERGEY